jgi:anti-sigma regulatory factor (Ser/Thr protein kinase)
MVDQHSNERRHDAFGRRPAADMEIELERNLEAPSLARAAVMGLCEDNQIEGSSCFTLALLVSEVVTNAVVHSEGDRGSPIEMAVALGEKVARVSVGDGGVGFTPVPRDPETHDGVGYGLYLLEKTATRWGVEALEGTCVWFEVGLDSKRSRAVEIRRSRRGG